MFITFDLAFDLFTTNLHMVDIHDQASLIISWPGISLLYIYICTVKY